MPRINAVSFHEERSIEAICRRVLAAGFDSLELSRPPFYEKLTTPGLRKQFAAWAGKAGLAFYGFDCWVDIDPYQRPQITLAEFDRAIDWAADLDLKLLITHDPWQSVNSGRSPAECLRATISLFRPVLAKAAQRDLRFVFEPHPDTLSMDNAWAIDLIDALASEVAPGSVGILYDCCHYGVGHPNDYVAAIHTLGSRIAHVHFSDGDKQTYALHLPLGKGSLDLQAIVTALVDIGFTGTLTNDLYNYPLLDYGAQHNVPRMREVEMALFGARGK